jgi:hypothetical protein
MNKLLLSGLAVLGLGFVTLPMPAKADSSMPPGYTLSKSPLKGQHCYYHGGGHVYYYCYPNKLSQPVSGDNVTQPAKATGEGVKNDLQGTGEGLKDDLQDKGEGIKDTLKNTGEGIKDTLEKPFEK